MASDFHSQFETAKSLFEAGRLKEAVSVCQALLDLDPNRFEALHLAGAIAGAAGNLDVATAFFRRAIAINNQIAEVHLNLGRILLKQGSLIEAEKAVEQAIALDPKWPDSYAMLGNVKDARHDGPGARAAVKQALSLDQDNQYNTKYLAQLESFYGLSDESEERLLRILETSPNDVSLYFGLAPIHRFAPGDPLIKAMETLLDSGTLDPKPKAKLLFSLGKAFDDINEIDKAFECLNSANRIQREHIGPIAFDAPQRCETIRSNFPETLFQSDQVPSNAPTVPVFIVGMPRSGSSLTEQVLAAHPETGAYGEIPYLSESIAEVFAEIGGAKYPKDIGRLSPSHRASIGQKYVDKLSRHGPLPKFTVEKMVTNYRNVGLIRLVFPNAKIVFCRRDPRAVGLSLYQRYFKDSEMAFSFDLQKIAEAIQSCDGLMTHWHSVLPGFIYDLTYEDFVEDFETGVRALLNACGLPWDDACLNYATLDRPVATASAFQVRQPIYQRSVGRWRKYEKHLGPLLELADR